MINKGHAEPYPGGFANLPRFFLKHPTSIIGHRTN